MIQTICVASLLREMAADGGGSEARASSHLLTRPTGAAVRGRIEAALAESNCLTALLDFTDIELLDLSCADEVVAKLLMAERTRAAHFVALQGLREDQHEAIEHVLTGHRLAVAAVPPGTRSPRPPGWGAGAARHAFARRSGEGRVGEEGRVRGAAQH